jgi:hypothetical protein
MTSINECKWCCHENCKILELDEEYWDPFKSLCDEEYHHNGTLTKDEFEDRYNGMWYDLSDFAKDLCSGCDDGSLDNLPWYIKQCVDWYKVWETISVDYNVYDNYVFRILR